MSLARWALIAVAVCALCCGQTAGPIKQAEPTVVTVTGQAIPVSATSASVTVLTREAIESSHADNVGDLLRQSPFLFLTQSGGRGGLTTVTLRGGKPNFTLVMIDGIPVNDISNVLGGSYDFSNLSCVSIEQIEIVRGPLSSVYGSDAVAGVINIIPRRGEDKSSLEIGAELGNFATRNVSIEAGGKVRNFDYTLGGSYLDIGEQVENDPFRLATLSFNSHTTFGAERILRFLARYHNSEAAGFPNNGGGPEFAILRNAQSVHTGELVTGIGWKHQVNSRWLYGADFDVFDRGQRSNVPAIFDAPTPTFFSVPSQASDTDFRRFRVAISNWVKISSALSAEFGAGWRGEYGTSNGILADTISDVFHLSRDTGDANAELLYRAGGLTASIGLRADKGGQFRTVLSPRAGISYRVRERGPRLKASWGKGFKLPSFYALADTTVGNPQLRPEFSRSFDAGIENDFLKGHLRASVAVFRNSYQDLVDFSAEIFRLVNRTQAETHGVEFGVAAPINRHLELSGNVSYLDWKLKNVTEPLRDVPHWRGGGSVDWRQTQHWQLGVESMWVGQRYDFQVPVPDHAVVGGYLTVNLVSSYEFSSKATGFVRVENLLDRKYHDFVGFPSPGVWVRVGVKWKVW